MKRVFIIHGWGGFPGEGWFPGLKKELEKKNFKVEVPSMPDSEHPKIETWIPFLKKVVGKLDEETYFVGHSIGCQTILRYLEKENKKCGKVILVAPWMNLDKNTMNEEEYEETLTACIKYECSCGYKGEIEVPFKRKKVMRLDEEEGKKKAVEALVFECEKCKKKFYITKKMK